MTPSTREFLQGIIDNIADPVFVKDEQHRWLVLNDAMCRFMGRARDALIGRSDFDFFPEEEARVFWEKDALVFRTGEENVNEEHFTDAAGVRHVISTKKTIFAIDEQRFLVGVIRDITEIKRAQADLEATSKALLDAKERAEEAARGKDEFLANTSHELRTPMNAVLGMTDLLLASDLDAEQRGYATLIREGATHLATLIDDILDLTRISAGKVEILERAFEPAALLQRSAALFEGQASERGLALDVALDELPVRVVGDERRLRQVVVNLLSNALKFTHEGSVRLTARTRPLDDEGARVMLEVEVEDTGIGIDSAQLHEIFERFRQLDASPTRRHGGLGLGLAISHGLVRAMGGELEVRSRPSVGSVFTVSLPLTVMSTRRASSQRGAAAATLSETAAACPLRLLVVEDNVVNQRVMRALLDRLGYSPVVVSDGNACLDAMVREGRRFDVVLMDVHMPGIDGLETTRILRASLPASEQPAIVGVTASALPRDRRACLDAGMDRYLAKPVRPTALRDMLLELGSPAGAHAASR
ncbi:MAG: response regulator [Myxococcales bacterium]|nr:response regulator [Myxococcales bacterium]